MGFDNDTQLANCRFDPNDPLNKFCPIFELDKIVQLAGDNFDDLTSSVTTHI